jgi:Zn-dependent protease with chaperone function
LESEDELAFVLGHEAGHHIARHIPQQRESAAEGARVFGEIAMAGGGNARDIRRAAQLGATVGRADLFAHRGTGGRCHRHGHRLSRRVRSRLRGRSFSRACPIPACSFLSTHPPNADRMRVVTPTVAAARGRLTLDLRQGVGGRRRLNGTDRCRLTRRALCHAG